MKWYFLLPGITTSDSLYRDVAHNSSHKSQYDALALREFHACSSEAKADPLTVLFLRFGIAAVVMCALLFASKTPLPRGLLLVELILLGAIACVGESLAYFTALTMTSPGLVALLLYIYPAMVTTLSALFLKEHLTTIKIVALFLALSGTALTIQITSGGSIVGILPGIAAAVDYAIYILPGSLIVKRSGTIGSTAIIIASTAGVYAIIAPVHGLSFPVDVQGWVAILAITLVSTVLAFTILFAGLKRIGPTTASSLSTFEPIVAVALAAVVLGETITPVQAPGGCRDPVQKRAAPEQADKDTGRCG